VTFSTTGDGTGKIANIAVVERGISIDVKRGENRGRKLSHDNVVKSFKSIAISEGNRFSTEIKIPDGIDSNNTSVIIYAQGLDDLKVHDAFGAAIKESIASN